MVELEDLAEFDTPRIQIRYRDNGERGWSNWVDVSLGSIGQTGFNVRLKRLGIFSSRQYEIRYSDNTPLVFSKAEADVTVLR